MRLLTLSTLAASALAVAACGSSSSSPAAIPAATASAVAAPPMSPPPTAVTLAPLTLANFPPTAMGDYARGVCEAWLALRQQYEDLSVTDSPYQLNQWFSGPAWNTAQADANALGDDPAYTSLIVAYTDATIGDMAGTATIRLMDKACSAGD